MKDYRVKQLKFKDGERYSILIDKETGLPDYWVTLFVTKTLRNSSQSIKTIESHLRHLAILRQFLENQKTRIDLDQRVADGKLLQEHELTQLAALCKMDAQSIRKKLREVLVSKKTSLSSPEKARSSLPTKKYQYVENDTAANRMRGIISFITWFAKRHISKLPWNSPIKKELEKSKDYFIDAFSALIPKGKYKDSMGSPQGLDEEAQIILHEIIHQNSVRNPWKGEFIKLRNELLVKMLITFGPRGGEILGIKLVDINMRTQTIAIVRRQDDPEETRREPANQKTREREMPIPDPLFELLKLYIFGNLEEKKNKKKGAKYNPKSRTDTTSAHKHKYLFVTESGDPLSKPSLQKIFSVIRAVDPALAKVTPHILRHTWNDNFSKLMDAKGFVEEDEQRMRSYLMGWNPTSDTAKTYTKRHNREKANKAILEMEAKMEEKTDAGKILKKHSQEEAKQQSIKELLAENERLKAENSKLRNDQK